jgi:L-fuconate dehydratase
VHAEFRHIKMKVGRDRTDDIRRLTIARRTVGPDDRQMVDANQVWEVDEAIDWMRDLVFSERWFIEEPTSPDDIEGHRRIRDAVSPVKVATGEMCQNRILFNQFICTSISSILAS